MEYKRYLSEKYLNLLEPGGALAPLVASTQAPWRTDLFLDLQLRRDDTVMLYAGLTRPLRVCRLKRSGAIRFSADEFYERQGCGMPWGERLDPIGSAAHGVDLKRYLDSVTVSASALQKEGRAQNWLSRRYGADRRTLDEWVAIDREVVISYQDMGERESKWGPVRYWAKDVAERLQNDREYSGRYGVTLEGKAIGQELDLLLWDPVSGCFWVTEVKDGSSAKGVYLSPLQVAAYTAIWRTFVGEKPEAALSGISRLVAQKKRLGLIAEGVELPNRLLPEMFRPLVVVQEPNSRSTCWARLQEVISLVQPREEDLESGAIIDNLPVWQIADGELMSLDGIWQRWASGGSAASEV